jgi:hypothetical protein
MDGISAKWLKAISGKSKSVLGFPVTKSVGFNSVFSCINISKALR